MGRGTRPARAGMFLCGMILVPRPPAWAEHPCAKCHPKEVAGYAVTQMARALGPPKARPPGKFFHALSGTRFSIQSTPARMVQRIERRGATGEYTVAYALGSGSHAYAYLIELDGHLFQSPIGYFCRPRLGDVAGLRKQPVPGLLSARHARLFILPLRERAAGR